MFVETTNEAVELKMGIDGWRYAAPVILGFDADAG